MRKIVFVIATLMFCSALHAQNKMSEINRIKRDKNYLYGEATLNTQEAALSLAYELLEAEIKNWAKEKSNKISSVVASQIYDYADTIILQRQNMVRAFAYVKTSNLNPVKGKSIKVDVTEDKNTPSTTKKIEVTAPKAVVQPKPAETVATTTAEPKPVAAPTPAAAPKPVEKQDFGKEVLAEIQKVTSFYDLEKTISPLHQQGKITSYGKYATMPDPAESYLIIYDANANIKAILGKGTSKRKNLSTGKDDSETNYKGCGAIWFKVKEQ